jgi:hypothetical protein
LQSEFVVTYLSPARLRDGVNRSLTVRLADAPVAVQLDYNPGGLLPEVEAIAPWPVFLAALGALVILLAIPVLVMRVVPPLAGRGKAVRARPRIRLEPDRAPRVRILKD